MSTKSHENCRKLIFFGQFLSKQITVQAGENVGLQNALGVTTEDNTYENPFDSSRRIFYAYDFWHALKNLRYQNLTK